MSWMGIKRERERGNTNVQLWGVGTSELQKPSADLFWVWRPCWLCAGLSLRSCESAPGLRRSRNNGWQQHQGLTSPIINPPALILLLSCSEMHLCPIRMIYLGEIYKVHQSLHSTGLCLQEEGRKPDPQISPWHGKACVQFLRENLVMWRIHMIHLSE